MLRERNEGAGTEAASFVGLSPCVPVGIVGIGIGIAIAIENRILPVPANHRIPIAIADSDPIPTAVP